MLTSRKMADWLAQVSGEDDGRLPTEPTFTNPSMEPERVLAHDRLIHVTNLWTMLDAVEKAGWHEHTGDWDWFAWVTMADGRKWEACCSWQFGTATEIVENFTACVDYEDRLRPTQLIPGEKPKKAITHLWLEVEAYLETEDIPDAEQILMPLAIADIVKIDLSEEH